MRFDGLTPLVMTNVRMANPYDVFSQKYKEITDIKAKDRTEEQMGLAFRIQWEGYQYRDDKLGPILPGDNIEACLKEGGRKLKLGKRIAEALTVEESCVKLEYAGPREAEAMWNAKKFANVGMVGKQGSGKRPICRPIFNPAWSAEFTVLLDDLKEDDILRAAQMAGRFSGLCCRTAHKWGRFEAKWV
jgi:hypothetical protein